MQHTTSTVRERKKSNAKEKTLNTVQLHILGRLLFQRVPIDFSTESFFFLFIVQLFLGRISSVTLIAYDKNCMEHSNGHFGKQLKRPSSVIANGTKKNPSDSIYLWFFVPTSVCVCICCEIQFMILSVCSTKLSISTLSEEGAKTAENRSECFFTIVPCAELWFCVYFEVLYKARFDELEMLHFAFIQFDLFYSHISTQYVN